MEWVQIQFPREIRGIKAVEVSKRTREFTRFSQVELRIGNVDESNKGAVQLSDNQLVGFFGEGVDERIAVFHMVGQVNGRFLTLQRLVDGFELAEVFIFV